MIDDDDTASDELSFWMKQLQTTDDTCEDSAHTRTNLLHSITY